MPVIGAFRALPGHEVSVVSVALSRPLLDGGDVAIESLDEAMFHRDPAACMTTVFDRVKPHVIVSGSSPAKGALPETPEQYGILAAKRLGVPSVGILDYWGMYEQRFVREGTSADLSLVPNKLCVLDRRAFNDLLALGVPPERMAVTHNPWMDRVVRDALECRSADRQHSRNTLHVLFVSQPFAETRAVRQWSYTQKTLFERLVRALPPLRAGESHRVTVWPHPAESQDRWHDLSAASRADVKVTISDLRGARIFGEIDLLVSGHSTVAYEALYHGVPCVSLRSAGESHDTLLTEELGLTHHLPDFESVRRFLALTDFEKLRRELDIRRESLTAQKVFFSDGNATARVTSEILDTMAQHWAAS